MRASEYDSFAASLDADIEARGSSLRPPFALPGVVLACGTELTPEPVEWLWPYWLALGKVHILAGAPGQGKTTIAAGALAATVTIGGRWPDGTRCTPGNVIVCSGEDDPADTLLPRFIAAGGDRSRIFFVQGIRDEAGLYPFDPARDMRELETAIKAAGGASLVILDPVVSAVTGDSHKNTEVRRSLQPLVDAAAAGRFAVLGITHFSKGGQGGDPTQRVIGSVAFSAVARVVLVAAKVRGENGEDRRILARSKSNIGPDDGGIEYHLEQVEALPGIEASRVTWGKTVEGSARALLTDVADDAEQAPRESAADFLREVLKDGPTSAKIVKAEAAEAGHAWNTVRRAADDLLIIKKKDGMAGGWYWQLAKMPPKNTKEPNVEDWVSSDSSAAQVSTFDESEGF
ncbi:AAA family ATPase [Hydrogenophaga sp.]|uniref:AAA family ATPase n=1 Tax=Hydrogenophaga sp. TaxID=1904254 RepID=UPI003F7249D0